LPFASSGSSSTAATINSSTDLFTTNPEDDLTYDADTAAVHQLVEDCLERVDLASDAAEQALQEWKNGGLPATVAGIPGGPWGLMGKRPGARAVAEGLPWGPPDPAGSSKRGFNRMQKHLATLPRPQEKFSEPVDNSNTAWVPRFEHLAGRVTPVAAAAAGGRGAVLHPYATELEQLR
jgi:hypothetical protein